MSFWSNLFSSPQETAAKESYNWWDKIKNTGDVQNIFGLKKRSAADVSQTFNPARQNLATRQAQANAAAGARMSGSNATPQATFGGITSAFAPSWGELESNAAKTGLDVERSDEQNIANMLMSSQEQKEQAGSQLSDTSTFGDIFSGVTNLAKIGTGGGSSNLLMDLFTKKKMKKDAQGNDTWAGGIW
jgi:hypothetical protein